jgi:hypothetical protein
MIADAVYVASRRFDQGTEQGRTLVFKNGLFGRPILLDRLTPAFPAEAQTVISLHLKQEEADRLLSGESLPESIGHEGITPIFGSQLEAPLSPFQRMIASICLTVDCDVFVQELDGASTRVHSRNWYLEDGEAWLTKLFVPQFSPDRRRKSLIRDAASRLTLIHEGPRIVGRAAISMDPQAIDFEDFVEQAQGKRRVPKHGDDLYVSRRLAFGGFNSSHPQFWGGTNAFFGVIEGNPTTAARYGMSEVLRWDMSKIFKHPEQCDRWLTEQTHLTDTRDLSEAQRATLNENLARFGIFREGYLKFRVTRRKHRVFIV